MDEPFGALDPITRDALQDEFKKLQKELHKTIIFVTHDMDEALKLADRVVIMRDGEVVQADTPEEILRNPANEFVEEFLGKERLIQGRPDVTTVGQIMEGTPITVQENESLKNAISIMRDKHVDSLLVLDQQEKLVGFIDIEIINLNYKKATLVNEVMEKEFLYVEKDSLLRDTVHKILRRGVKYVPVVDEEKKLVGIVTRATLANLVYDTIWGDGFDVEEHVDLEIAK